VESLAVNELVKFTVEHEKPTLSESDRRILIHAVYLANIPQERKDLLLDTIFQMSSCH
jgi:hypothetical protein